MRLGKQPFSTRLPFLLSNCLKCLCALVALSGVVQFNARAVPSSQSDEVRPLQAAAPVERELPAGQIHGYQLSLAAAQYLRITIDQRGCDVAATLLNADGQPQAQADYDVSLDGQEILSLVTQTAGVSRLIVRSKSKLAGRYVLKLAELRAATPQDGARVNAYRLLMEARELLSKETAESMRQSAIKFDEALAAWKPLGDQYGEAVTLDDAGRLYFNLAAAKKSLDHWTQALTLWRTLGQRMQEGRVLSNLGMLNYASGTGAPALTQYEQALALHREEGDKYWEAETLNRLGWLYNAREERLKAIEYFNLALPLRRTVGDRAGEAVTLNDLGRTHDILGNKQQAIIFFEHALRLNSPEENPDGLANTLIRLGVVYDSIRESQQALDAYGQALSLLERVNNRRTLASALSNIGLVYANLGDYSRALEYYDRSLKLSRELGMRGGEAATLHNSGLVYRALAKTQAAIDSHNQALTIYKSSNNRGGQAMVLQAMGVIYYDANEPRRALEALEQSLTLRRAINDRRGEAITLTSLGYTLMALGETQKAHDHFSQALPLQKAVANLEGEAETLMGLAQAKHGLGESAASQRLIEQSLQLTESIRAKVPGQELRASYFAAIQHRYEQGLDLLMRMKQDAAALQVSERARARSLLEMLTEVGANIRQGVAASLLAQERAIGQRLDARAEAQTRLLSGKYTEMQASAIAQEIADLTAQLKDVETEIRRASPRYAALTQPHPLSATEIQNLLDDDTLLLEYALGEKVSYLWAVTPTAINSYALPARAEIEQATRQVYEKLRTRTARGVSLDPHFIAQTAALSQMLLGPAANQLGKKRLIIVSSGVLAYLPFAALSAPRTLPKDNQPLVATHEIVNLPSASVLSVIRRETQGRKPASQMLAILADPVFDAQDPRVTGAKNVLMTSAALSRALRAIGFRDGLARLAFSRQEAEAIFAVVPRGTGLKATDFSASRATATSEGLSQYRMLHFATHGLLNSEQPDLSGLVFSLVDEKGSAQDGFLRLHEVFNLKLNADLVVLSACETGLGKDIKGEGLIGLTRGFMYAGAPRVVASLWNVDDLATAELMKLFYRHMLKDGLRPAAALRAAQLELARQPRWAAPYFWAGFILQGEWK